MNKVIVSTKQSYEVLIGENILNQLGQEILKLRKISKVVVVTDDIVEKLYLDTVVKSLMEAGFQVNSIVINSGEENKTPNTYFEVIEKMAKAELNREDFVIGLGGGVVCDIAGFAAATYMRGIDIVQVPTTLLCAIDASVGGKTGVDLAAGKNLLGAFHQPKLVFFDSSTLKTLKEVDIKNGLGEGIKYAILSDLEILQILESGLNEENILKFVELAVSKKRDIVVKDEYENGERKLLNLGHTFGHAIEKLSNFEIPHGIAVAKGISIIARASKNAGILSISDFNLICDLFKKYNMDTACPFTTEQLFSVIKMDKKMSSNNEISFVDINSIGNCVIKRTSLEWLKGYVNECKN